jgi:hypothetical protein
MANESLVFFKVFFLFKILPKKLPRKVLTSRPVYTNMDFTVVSQSATGQKIGSIFFLDQSYFLSTVADAKRHYTKITVRVNTLHITKPFFKKKRLPGVGSEPGASRFHLFSHFHHFI